MAHHAINKLDSPLGNVDQNWKMAFLRAVISTTTAVGALGADHQPKFMGLSTSSVRLMHRRLMPITAAVKLTATNEGEANTSPEETFDYTEWQDDRDGSAKIGVLLCCWSNH